MPLPDRPVDAATIDTDWGQQVHDYTFAPKGCELAGTTRTVNTTPDELDISIATDDPGGFMDAGENAAIVPTGGEGLYLVCVRMNAVGGDAGTQSRVWLYINDAGFASAVEDNDGGVNVVVALTILVNLSAGDKVEVFGQRRGSGTNPTVHVLQLQLLRMGAEYGA